MGRRLRNSDTRVYCAGPLFNAAERREMEEIADVLLEAGYSVYLPHRDGMEFRLILDILTERGWEPADAAQFLHASIFALDVYQLAVACDCMVWNLNGRVPDEGAVAEAAMAWTLGKPLVAYSDDVRSLIAGRVNPLLVGMVDFQRVGRIEDLPHALKLARHRAASPGDGEPLPLSPALRRAVDDGKSLWEALQSERRAGDNAFIADVVACLFSPEKRASLLA